MTHRKFNWKKLKPHKVYTISELCDVLRCGPVILKRIMREEHVPVSDDRMPALVVGADILPVLRTLSKPATLPLGHMYCFRCKRASFPAGGMLERVSDSLGAPLFRALCGCCQGIMCRRVAMAEQDAFIQAVQSAQSKRP